MSTVPSLRWGVLGAARIARSALVPALRAAGQQVERVAARNPARAEAFAAELGMGTHESYEALIADPNLDAVYIALTNDAHCRWAVAALDAGKHVLCEKPLALNTAEVQAMREAEQRSGRLMMEAFCHIYHPRLADLMSAIGEGRLGDLVSIELNFVNPLDNPADFRWKRALGGGATYDLLVYCTTLVTTIMGAQPESVVARQTLRGEVDLSMGAILQFPATMAMLHASFTGAAQQHLTIIGTENIARLDRPIGHKQVEVSLEIGAETRTYPALDPYKLMVEEFVSAATGAGTPRFPSKASLANAGLTERIMRAAQEGIAA